MAENVDEWFASNKSVLISPTNRHEKALFSFAMGYSCFIYFLALLFISGLQEGMGEAASTSIITNSVLLFLVYLGFLIAIPSQFWYLSSEINSKKSKSIISKKPSGSSVALWIVGLVILDLVLFSIVWYDMTAYPEGSITHLLVVLLFYINLFASLSLIVLGPVYLLVLLIISWRRRKERSARGLAKYILHVFFYLSLGPIVGSVLWFVAAFSAELVS